MVTFWIGVCLVASVSALGIGGYLLSVHLHYARG